jgi:hypothetical protein
VLKNRGLYVFRNRNLLTDMENKETQEDRVTDEMIMNHIYVLRGQKVMIDTDLAKLYQVEDSKIRAMLKKNADRFPNDFMFKLNNEDELSLIKQDSSVKRNSRIRASPFAFTEQGLSMLSGMLKSKQAIAVNIRIIRIFSLIRQILPDFPELYREMEQFKNNLLSPET